MTQEQQNTGEVTLPDGRHLKVGVRLGTGQATYPNTPTGVEALINETTQQLQTEINKGAKVVWREDGWHLE